MIFKSVQGDQVFCSWMDQDGSLRFGIFHINMVAVPIALMMGPTGIANGRYS